jgi:hypothetical protein
MSLSFLLQATRVLHIGNYDEDEVRMIFDYVRTVDNEMIFNYINTNTIISYDNDLGLLIEVIDKLMVVLEETEDYEKCLVLKNKKEQCLKANLEKTN